MTEDSDIYEDGKEPKKESQDSEDAYSEDYDTDTDKGAILNYAKFKDGAFGSKATLTVFPTKREDGGMRRLLHLQSVPLEELHEEEKQEFIRLFGGLKKDGKSLKEEIEKTFRDEPKIVSLFDKDVETLPAVGGGRMKDLIVMANGQAQQPVRRSWRFWKR